MISVEVTGDKELIADLRGYEKQADKAIQKAVDDTARKIKEIAITRLKGGLGSAVHVIAGWLIGSIYDKPGEKLERMVGTGQEYAPYIEFGTGELVFQNFEFDADSRRAAAEYKGKKKVKGIRGDSFLNYGAVNQRKKFIERITDNLNKIK